MPAPHDYIYTFTPGSDEPEIGEKPGVDLRKAPADTAMPPPEVPPVATRPPATLPPQPAPAEQPAQIYDESGNAVEVEDADTVWVEEWDDDDWDGEEDYEQAPPVNKSARLIKVVFTTLIILIFFALIPTYKHTSHMRKNPPMGEMAAAFEKKMHIYDKWPFVMPYYVMLPERYDPRYPYPLVMELHGMGYKSYAARYLAQPGYRHAFPAIVVVPVMYEYGVWRTPPEKRLYIGPAGTLLSVDALDAAVQIIFKLANQYTVDPTRVYIVGENTGGMGVYAAAVDHGDLFAAGVTSGGTWSEADADRINIPILAYHGMQDRKIPAMFESHFADAVASLGGTVHFNAMPNRDSGVAEEVFSNPQTWQWLFSQRKMQ